MLDISAASDVASGSTRATREGPIDLVQLARMTLGDRGLEREVLQLFARQVAMLVDRMQGKPVATVAAVAHTLKGSARGVGAWRVVGAAEAVEHAAGSGEAADLEDALRTIRTAADEVRATIAELLRAN
jgi:HPt (histidine-containing phosphotransfer) domain-containing protein